MSPRHFGYSCDQSDIGQSPPPSDLSFHPLWPRKNPSILSPVRINNDHQLRSRFRHKIRKFRQASRPRTDPRLSIPALLQNMNAPTGSQNIWTTASRLYSVPNDELVLRSLQSNLPSLQEVVESSPTGSESLDLPPLQRLLPSFDTMFKTAAAIIDEKLPVLIPTRETYRVSDIFPIRL